MGFFVEQVRGVEPPYSAWEADVLPMNYTCMCHDYSTKSVKNQGDFCLQIPACVWLYQSRKKELQNSILCQFFRILRMMDTCRRLGSRFSRRKRGFRLTL